jgi:hypothetical protein
MKTVRKMIVAVAFVVFFMVPGQAHEGHGHESPLSPGHYIANPEHALPVALTLITALAGGWLIYRAAVRVKRK